MSESIHGRSLTERGSQGRCSDSSRIARAAVSSRPMSYVSVSFHGPALSHGSFSARTADAFSGLCPTISSSPPILLSFRR